MSISLQEDTSYKYRKNQNKLLGKIISGTLDEDLCISNLKIDSAPQQYWKNNPIFKGTCFANKHKLSIGIEVGDYNASGDLLNGIFQNSININEVLLDISYTGRREMIRHAMIALCRYAVDIEKIEVRFSDNVQMSSVLSMCTDATALTTVVFRSSRTLLMSGDAFINKVVDTIVLDSPYVANLGDPESMASDAFKSGGVGGTIYIPKSLYDHLGDGSEYDYKASTNWSAVDARGTITWAQIEGSEYEAE